ncbi:hypothetical protein CRG98_011703 [Punica granatum]|uniref:Uncharacterized protein n=1 Tax=Punica granatum TaxID=22663 RepID=A0A2I0KHV4_PUNGR|nr:hypothetical protein CRG98_011703 [Punica granatum]
MGRGPLAGDRDLRRTAAVLAPGRRDDGTRGRGRWLWTPPMLHHGRSGPHRCLISRNRGKNLRFSGESSEFSDLQIGQIERKISISCYWVVFFSSRIPFLFILISISSAFR